MVEESGNTSDFENDDKATGEAYSNFVDDGELIPNISNPNLTTSNSTGPLYGPAKEEKIGKKLFLDTVRAEQREKLLKSLVNVGVGTNRMETNQLRSRGEMKWDYG